MEKEAFEILVAYVSKVLESHCVITTEMATDENTNLKLHVSVKREVNDMIKNSGLLDLRIVGRKVTWAEKRT